SNNGNVGIHIDNSISQSSTSNIINNNTASNNDFGILIDRSVNNTVIGNTASNNAEGIAIWSSNSNTIINNTASNNSCGIYLSSSSSNTIINNTVSSNIERGIYVRGSSNTIVNNTISYGHYWGGISLSSAKTSILTNNVMTECGLFISGQDDRAYWNTHSIDTSNTVDGKPVQYWKNQTGGTVPVGAGQVILANCTDVVVENQDFSDVPVGVNLGYSKRNTIANNTISNTISGIRFYESNKNDITNNLISNNSWAGIYAFRSDRNTIANNDISNNNDYGIWPFACSYTNIDGNTVSNNDYGIYFFGSDGGSRITNNTVTYNNYGIHATCWDDFDDNTIENNTVMNNNYGIWIETGSQSNGINTIFHNSIINNAVQAYDSGTNFWGDANSWDNGYPDGGNYWSDYNGTDIYSGLNQDQSGSDGIGDEPYDNITGDNGALDNYPLMEPWWTPPKPDLYIYPEDITFSNPNPSQWEEITIDANVHNQGEINATCTVSFYLDEVIPENLIYREYEVFVPGGRSTVVSHDWIVDVSGNHTIIVNITDSNPPEADLSNNQASKVIYISEPCGKLKVKASSDKQKYISGVDNQADIIVKVTYQGQPIEGANVCAWVIDPNEVNTSVSVSEVSPGIYTGVYLFTNDSAVGTHRIKAIASKPGYENGTNNDCKDKFFLDSPVGNAPDVLSVEFSEHILAQGSEVIITAEVTNPAEVSSIFADMIKHGTRSVFAHPLFDDGTHSDITPGDGIYTSSLPTDDMSGTFTADVCVNGRLFENRNVLIVNPEDLIAFETIAGIQTSANKLYYTSSQTNVTLNVTTAVDISDISFTIVEHRTVSEGKSIEIIPSANIEVAMEVAYIEVSYTDSDIPDGVNETDMRLHLWDPYVEELVPLIPGGVNTNDDIVWGDADHFSEFAITKSVSKYDIQLDPGWNLISLPLVQADTSIFTVLSSIEGQWDYVRYYDAADKKDHWKAYSIYKPPSLNDLWELDHTMGFWLHATEECTLTVYGQVPISTSIPLYAGWNLVGYPTMGDSKSVGDALWGTGADKVEICDTSEPYDLREVEPSYTMKHAEGYWIHVPADTIWVINW
ncbi:MAG: right-handed parallel beta-helix repeat-containing protein, partial [Thermoplasmata archaeon]|nr:right-handed parallel beta-helix repeat-containing protein [Thermoplasmata archaeon]